MPQLIRLDAVKSGDLFIRKKKVDRGTESAGTFEAPGKSGAGYDFPAPVSFFIKSALGMGLQPQGADPIAGIMRRDFFYPARRHPGP